MFVDALNRALRLGSRLRARRAHAEIDDRLFAFLVGTIHSAVAPLAASMAMAMLITLVAYQMTGSATFLAHALAQAAISTGRLLRLSAYRDCERAGASRRDIAACDNAFAFWSRSTGSDLGLICYQLTALSEGVADLWFALSACTGFALAFVTRSAGRLRTLSLQVAGLTAPFIYGLLTLPVANGPVYVALVLGLAAIALVLGRHGNGRLVALFEAHEHSRRLAEVDVLTGLMNRLAVTQAFTRALDAARNQPGERLVVCVVDLDRFKDINDSYGHAVGDAVLIEAARRLGAASGASAAVARMGGDEFLLLLAIPRRPAPRGVRNVGPRRFVAAVRNQRSGAAVGGSLGLAVYPQHGRDMTELLRHADFALYDAKRGGRGRMRVFDDALHTQLLEERALEAELNEALRANQFEVWYQPIQELVSGTLRGYEALARWRHPTRGLVPPDVFVRLAEQNGVIFRLGEIVLKQACREAAGWDRRLSVSVNLSPAQFRRPEPLVEAVKGALSDLGLEPSRLYLEITESSLMENSPQTRRAISELANYGVRFSLDDFGAGYSSLAYIQNYPFSTIKIDRAFVANIHTDPSPARSSRRFACWPNAFACPWWRRASRRRCSSGRLPSSESNSPRASSTVARRRSCGRCPTCDCNLSPRAESPFARGGRSG